MMIITMRMRLTKSKMKLGDTIMVDMEVETEPNVDGQYVQTCKNVLAAQQCQQKFSENLRKFADPSKQV